MEGAERKGSTMEQAISSTTGTIGDGRARLIGAEDGARACKDHAKALADILQALGECSTETRPITLEYAATLADGISDEAGRVADLVAECRAGKVLDASRSRTDGSTTFEERMRLTLEEMGAEVGETYRVVRVGDVVCLDSVRHDAYKADVAAQEDARAAEIAEECKRAATDCQRATQGLRWAVERFARERGGGNGFSVMAINELAKRADERAACAGGRASDVVATLQGAAR